MCVSDTISMDVFATNLYVFSRFNLCIFKIKFMYFQNSSYVYLKCNIFVITI